MQSSSQKDPLVSLSHEAAHLFLLPTELTNLKEVEAELLVLFFSGPHLCMDLKGGVITTSVFNPSVVYQVM